MSLCVRVEVNTTCHLLTWSRLYLQSLHQVLAVFRRRELKMESSKILQVDNCNIGTDFVVNVADGSMQHLWEIGGLSRYLAQIMGWPN